MVGGYPFFIRISWFQVAGVRVHGLGLGAWNIGFKAKIKNVRFEAIEFKRRNAD